MCWNFDEEKLSRVAAFITDCSRDKRCDGTLASIALPSPAARGRETTPATGEQISTLISTLTDGESAVDAVPRNRTILFLRRGTSSRHH